MNYTPLVQALGLRPVFWAHFTFRSKQVWWDERIRRDVGFVQVLSPSGQMMQKAKD